MDTGPGSDDEILELAREYQELRTTLQYLRSRIEEEEERARPMTDYLASLREQYSDGKRRVAEIRTSLEALEPVTLSGMKAKALVFESARMERGPSLRRSVMASTKGTRR